ncbi:CHAT domain-containing protein [Anabaena sp. PCC 7108]|uniref:CHAT domain-containing protein n=1 Tax=Anabaena sp. PCC 7108 TaxID=163908 RepID=UPI00036082B0|nr:CHAT domain-containing protein [Anabaena sp. PCC 7108]
MSNLPSELLIRLKNILVQCEQFESDYRLMYFFKTGESLSPWYLNIPQANSLESRVDNVIAFLLDKHLRGTQENALVLLLRSLSNSINQQDERHEKLTDLAVELKTTLGSSIHTALKSILLLAANPKNTPSLRLQEEEREIRKCLRNGQVLNTSPATQARDIQKLMLSFQPQIVHFSGHGAGEKGLVFEDVSGEKTIISSEALANMLESHSRTVKCVVLNGCYSKFQAEAIAQHIDFVIGMSQDIGDRAAIAFSVGFYTALGFDRDIEESYKQGCKQIEIDYPTEHSIPVIFKKKQ